MGQKIDIINNWNLSKLFSNLENGNFKIPKFQREYVWEKSKIVKLLNSIYKQYPIGSFFIWEAGKEYADFCRHIEELGLPEAPESNMFSFILDGQQRITSLYVALKKKATTKADYTNICFNLRECEFHIPKLRADEFDIPAWKLLDSKENSNIVRELVVNGHLDLCDNWQNCSEVFNQYPISIIKTSNMDLEEVVEIFERINQGGKRLSLFDLVAASVWASDFDLRDNIKVFNKEDKVKIFGEIDNEVFTQSLSLNAFGDCTNKVQLRLRSDDCKQIWDKTLNSIRLAIDYVKKSYGVLRWDFIPYSAFIPIIQYYMYKNNGKKISAEHKPYIDNWFWTSTFSQHYSSSTLTKMKEDAVWVDKLLNGTYEENTHNISLTVKDLAKIKMNNASVIKNGVLCIMALNSPVDFSNGESVSLDNTNISRSNAKENHHFFPFSLQREFGTNNDGINLLLNFAFISKALNGEILNKKPSIYLKDYAGKNINIIENLQTHFINEKAYQYAQQDRYEDFIQERGLEILRKIHRYTKTENNPIDDTDTAVDVDDNTTSVIPKRRATFSINGEGTYPLGRTVLEVIKRYVSMHPGITFAELREVFPNSIRNTNIDYRGCFTTIEDALSGKDKRHFVDEEDVIHLKDCNIAVSTEWGAGPVYSTFCECAKEQGYLIEKTM